MKLTSLGAVAALLLAGVLAAGLAHGGEIDWNDPVGGPFHDGTNWLGGVIPWVGDSAVFDLSSVAAYLVTVDRHTEVDRLLIRDDKVELDLGGFAFTPLNAVDASFVVGDGASDTGEVRFTNGTLTTQYTRIGNAVGSSGSVIGSGAGLTWESTYELYVGFDGSGSVTIENGAQLDSAYETYVGYNPGATGTLTVTGAGSRYDAAWNVNVRRGDVYITNGATFESNYVYLADAAGETAGLTVSGPGTTWTGEMGTTQNIGLSGTGTAVVSGGAAANLYSANVGCNIGSSGSLTVSGSSMDVTLGLFVGNHGTGTASILSGGAVSCRRMRVGFYSDGTGSVDVGSASSTGNTLDMDEGLWLGYRGGAGLAAGTGTLTVHGGNTVTVGEDTIIGTNVSSGGTLAMRGGTLSTAGLTVHAQGQLDFADGMVTVTGGSFSASADLSLQGGTPGDLPTLKLMGTPSGAVGGSLYLGGDNVSAGNPAAMIMDGAVLDVTGTVKIWPNGTLTLTNGSTLSAAAVELDGTLNWVSGTVHFTGAGLNIGGASLSLYAGQDLEVDAATTIQAGGALTMSGGSLTSGSVDIQPGGTVTLNSGSLSGGTITNAGTLTFNAGSLGITGDSLVIGAAGLLGATVNAAAGQAISVSGQTFIDPGASLTIAGGSFATQGIVNSGSLSLISGELRLTGEDLVIDSGGLLGDNVTVGSGLTLVADKDMIVAEAGTGALTVSGGGQVAVGESFRDMYIAHQPGATGQVTVTGTGSTLHSRGRIYVGCDFFSTLGTGSLTIQSGGHAELTYLYIGETSTAALDGGVLTAQRIENEGTFTWTTGTLDLDFLCIGDSDSVDEPLGDELTVNASRILDISQLTVGYDVSASLTITGGAHSGGTLTMGPTALGSGAVRLNGGTLGLAGGVTVTRGGLQLDPGSALTSAGGNLIDEDGIVNVDGAVWQILDDGTLQVGGRLNVSNGGDITTAGATVVNLDPPDFAPECLAALSGAGTTLTVMDELVVGEAGFTTMARLEIDGGAEVTAASATLAKGRWDYLSNSADVDLSGSGSQLTVTGPLAVGLRGTATLDVTGGAALVSAEATIGSGASTNWGGINWKEGTGTVTIDGASSTWNSPGSLHVGLNGVGTLNVTGGGSVTSGDALLGVKTEAEADPVSGSATVSGADSSWNIGGDLYVGGDDTAAGAPATLTVENGATAGVTRSVRIWAPGTLNVDNATFSAGMNMTLAGSVNFTGGAITADIITTEGGLMTWTSAGTLTLTIGGLAVGDAPHPEAFLGDWVTLGAAQVLDVAGRIDVGTMATGDGYLRVMGGSATAGETVTIGPLGKITLNGGQIIAPRMEVHTGALLEGHGTVTGEILGLPGSRITASGGNLTLGDPASHDGLSTLGLLFIGNNQVTLRDKGFAEAGSIRMSNGTLVAANGLALGAGDDLIASGTVNARIAAGFGSIIEASGNDLTLGDAASPAGFASDGELRVSLRTVTIHDADQAVLGTLTTMGLAAVPDLYFPGTLTVPNGSLLEFGKSLDGFGTVNGAFVNHGDVYGGTSGQTLEFMDPVTGVGDFHNSVTFSGGYSPGLSPIEVDLDDVTFSATNTLSIELGGLAPGSGHDKLNISGVATLGGTLDISLISNFTPQVGDEFEIMTYASAAGEFGETTGWLFDKNKALVKVHGASGLTLFATYRGDITLDGVVDGADYTVWADNYKQAGGWTEGDVTGNGFVDGGDYTIWADTFTGGGGAVPEPAALLILALAAPALLHRRKGKAPSGAAR